MSRPGFGVMIGQLGGNSETVAAYHKAIGKKIAQVSVSDDVLQFQFEDGSALLAQDEGQSCCESRYMVCDDDLAGYAGAMLTALELREGPEEPSDYGDHEVQFLVAETTNGPLTVASHNEHNGYYGGFWITLRYDGPTEPKGES